jgi:SRSO17 transposase
VNATCVNRWLACAIAIRFADAWAEVPAWAAMRLSFIRNLRDADDITFESVAAQASNRTWHGNRQLATTRRTFHSCNYKSSSSAVIVPAFSNL